MTNSTFSFFSRIFGFIVAVISLVAFIIKISQSHLPSNKIKILESLLDETETFFKKGVEDGHLTQSHETESQLAILRTQTRALQSTAYSATTLYRDYSALLDGTSSAIGRTCDSLKKLRAHVVTSSEAGRRRRELNSRGRREVPVQSSENDMDEQERLPRRRQVVQSSEDDMVRLLRKREVQSSENDMDEQGRLPRRRQVVQSSENDMDEQERSPRRREVVQSSGNDMDEQDRLPRRREVVQSSGNDMDEQGRLPRRREVFQSSEDDMNRLPRRRMDEQDRVPIISIFRNDT